MVPPLLTTTSKEVTTPIVVLSPSIATTTTTIATDRIHHNNSNHNNDNSKKIIHNNTQNVVVSDDDEIEENVTQLIRSNPNDVITTSSSTTTTTTTTTTKHNQRPLLLHHNTTTSTGGSDRGGIRRNRATMIGRTKSSNSTNSNSSCRSLIGSFRSIEDAYVCNTCFDTDTADNNNDTDTLTNDENIHDHHNKDTTETATTTHENYGDDDDTEIHKNSAGRIQEDDEMIIVVEGVGVGVEHIPPRSIVTFDMEEIGESRGLSRTIDNESRSLQRQLSSSSSSNSTKHQEDEVIIEDNKKKKEKTNIERWVRTTFIVQNICCATEVPIVTRILRYHCSCTTVSISITTKHVITTYNTDTIQTKDIIQILNNNNFPTKVLRTEVLNNSNISSNSSNTTRNDTSSVLLTQQQQQQQLNKPIRKIKASEFVESTISVMITHTPPEQYYYDKIHNEKILQTIMKQNYPNTSIIRSCTICSIVSHQLIYIKIEHNPQRVTITSIMNVIAQSKYYTNVSLITDGAVEGLYLPKMKSNNHRIDTSTMTMEEKVIYVDDEDENDDNDDDDDEHDYDDALNSKNGYNPKLQDTYNDNNKVNKTKSTTTTTTTDTDENVTIRMELYILLSGIFWVISILSTLLIAKDSKWRYLEYTGLCSVLFGLPPILQKAYHTIRRYQFDSNCMMSIAAIGACILGEWDEAASVSFLFSISDYMEVRASSRARLALQAIIQLRPEHATIIDETTNDVSIVPATLVPIHTLLSVRTGDKIAADGIVVEGTSLIDQSSLTGESKPVQVKVGSIVPGGSINIGTTPLRIRTTAEVQDSAVSRLIRLVEDAQSNSSPTEKLVDTFARAYTPAIVGMAAILASVPWLWGTDVGRTWTVNALILIVIACPCALTISTPVTYAAGLAATAQRGVVCKGGATLEALGSIRTVIFDKTGTLTEGKFVVTHLQLIGDTYKRHEMLELLALIEAPSSHPLSTTLVQAVKSEGCTIPMDVSVSEHTLLPGEGVTAIIDGKRVYVGNRRLFDRLDMYNDIPIESKQAAEHWESHQGGTVGFIGVEKIGVIGSYCCTDVVRVQAKDTVQSFLQDGLQVLMLTGDGEGAAQAVARQVGLPESAVHSQLLPEDKLRFVTDIKSTQLNNSETNVGLFNLFRSEPKVLFCGDGVNDAPALTYADVGISMGEGAALAMEMSDVTLMDSNLSKLQYVVDMGSRVLQTIRENILISLLCKVVVIVLTFAGYMTLLLAIASDVGVMLLVTLNGMKLLPQRNSLIVAMDEKKHFNAFRRQRYNMVKSSDLSDSDDIEIV